MDFTGDEASILGQIRTLVSILPSNNEDDMSYGECQDDLNRICNELAGCAGDTALALTLISDNNFFLEVKKNYEPAMVTRLHPLKRNHHRLRCKPHRGLRERREDRRLRGRSFRKGLRQGCGVHQFL